MPEPISYFEFLFHPASMFFMVGGGVCAFFVSGLFRVALDYFFPDAGFMSDPTLIGVALHFLVGFLGAFAFSFHAWVTNPAGVRGYRPIDYCAGEKASETRVHAAGTDRYRVLVRRSAPNTEGGTDEETRLSWLVAEMSEQDRWGGIGAADCRYFSYDEEEKADAVLYFDNGSLAEGHAQIAGR